MQELSLNWTDPTSLPAQIGQLTHLSKLELMGNRLHDLPQTFSELQQLEVLFLNDNQLSEVPPVLFQLSSLRRLVLRNGVVPLSWSRRTWKLTSYTVVHRSPG